MKDIATTCSSFGLVNNMVRHLDWRSERLAFGRLVHCSVLAVVAAVSEILNDITHFYYYLHISL